jgi:hypothetical protein
MPLLKGSDMLSNIKGYCEQLVRRFPDLETVLAEHVANNDDILPHVFMGEVTRYVLSDPPSRKNLVSYLENSLLEGAADIQELIAVSFVENLQGRTELERALKDVTGEGLRKEWHHLNGQ